MKVLVACEESQAVAKAFRKLGHEAYSCDIQDCSGGEPQWHIKGDALVEAYSGKYDLMIAHPPCTYLAVSGARWMYNNDGSICLERLKNLPKLKPTKIVNKGEFVEWIDKNGKKKRQAKWYLDVLTKAKTKAERQKLRSKTYQGIADAMAQQWSI